MKRSFVVTMLAAVMCSSLTLGADAKDKGPGLDGTWVPSSAELAGKKLPADAFASWKRRETAGQWHVAQLTLLRKGAARRQNRRRPGRRIELC